MKGRRTERWLGNDKGQSITHSIEVGNVLMSRLMGYVKLLKYLPELSSQHSRVFYIMGQ